MVKLNTSYEVPVGSEFFTLYAIVKLALYVVTSVHPAEDRFGRVALSVVDEDASVEEFAPVFLFGGVGDGCAE